MRPLCLTIIFISVAAAAAESAPATPPEADISRQIKLLGSDDFNEREAAEAALVKFGDKAEQALRAAAKGDDPEVRIRAARTLAIVLFDHGCKEEGAWLASLGPILGTSRPGDPATAGKDTSPEDNEEPGPGATDHSLAWLARTQEPDGHWDTKKYGAATDGDIAQTALATLAMLGAGHTEKVGAYRQNVKNAVAWLNKHQREDGAIVIEGKRVDPIAHALAGTALAEAAGMARKSDAIQAAQKAVNFSTDKLQLKDDAGLSGFAHAEGKDPDLLTTMFFVMQLKSAKVAGLTVTPAPFEGALKFLESCSTGGGSCFSFVPTGKPSSAATFFGCHTAMFLGYKKEDLERPIARAYEHSNPVVGEKESDSLLLYSTTLALFISNGRNPFNMNNKDGQSFWQLWNKPMRENLMKAMIQTGPNRGSWDPAGRWASGGRVLTTALHCLCLQTYYRYVQLRN